MKNLRKALFAFALLAILAVSGAFASMHTPAAAPKADNVYTYYLEGECDEPISCSPDYSGAVCAIAFSGSIVYDAPGCEELHQTSSIIGKKQP